MIHYIFDLDDTLIIHKNRIMNYHMMREDKLLSQLLKSCKGSCYIYTNGTGSHALTVLDKMNITDKFEKIYSRDTMDYMKPEYNSFYDVHDDLSHRDPDPKVIFFFDDRLENLETASKLGWLTFWINPNYKTKWNYPYINLAFPNIKDCLTYLETKM